MQGIQALLLKVSKAQDQLRELLTANSVRVIDLFRQWDTDGNGVVDKKEFRRAVAAFGFEAPKEEWQ